MSLILPALFVSHGAPDILTRPQGSGAALRALGHRMPGPRGIVIVSAHWISDPVGITVGKRLETIHDFTGFPEDLYTLQYPARGDDDLSRKIAAALLARNLDNELVQARGLDHGAWIPLYFMYPDARIPVVQVSLPAGSLQDLAELGKALAPLRREGLLIIGSGGSVHNLRALNRDGRTDEWALEFEAWLHETVENNHFERLSRAQEFTTTFRQAHPTLEHYAPLIVVWAAAGVDQPGRRIHHGFDYGNLGMSCFEFGRQAGS